MLRFCTPIRDVVTTSYSRLIEMPHTVSQGLVASCRSVYAAIMAVPRFLLLWILVPVHLVQHMVLGICHGVIGAWRFFISIPGRIIRSPVQTYRAVIRGRDWLMAKVEYLQAESRKWRTAFAIVKSPYSLLRSCGLSPQAAMALLFAGSTVGTGVVVNETVFAQKSFSRGDAGVYNAPLDAPIRYEEGNNTLRIDLGTTPGGAILTGGDVTSSSWSISRLTSLILSIMLAMARALAPSRECHEPVA
jgi:hypothetical protein